MKFKSTHTSVLFKYVTDGWGISRDMGVTILPMVEKSKESLWKIPLLNFVLRLYYIYIGIEKITNILKIEQRVHA